MIIRCCLAIFSLVLLAACEAPAGDNSRPQSQYQVPAGGGGGY